MKQEPSSTAVVIGFTDDREATGPQADLDRRRAEAVRDYLVTRTASIPRASASKDATPANRLATTARRKAVCATAASSSA